MTEPTDAALHIDEKARIRGVIDHGRAMRRMEKIEAITKLLSGVRRVDQDSILRATREVLQCQVSEW